MGMGDGLFYGSSFDAGGGGAGFDAGFERGPFGVGGEGAWGGGHGVRFEFRPRDPMELFDVSCLTCVCLWRSGCLMEGAGDAFRQVTSTAIIISIVVAFSVFLAHIPLFLIYACADRYTA